MFNTYAQQRTGLQAKFEKFKQSIELTQNQKDKIISSHTHLRQRNLQPLNYVKESFLTGSYKKSTMIRPPSDVDAFVVVQDSRFSNTPNSVLNKLKRDLNYSYPNSIIRQDKPCIVLDFSHCKFELTPAIMAGHSHDYGFYIPKQGANEWMLVDSPRRFENELSQANNRLNGMLTPLIKMMKACKKFNSINDIKSFEMEEKAVNSLYSVLSYRDGIQKLLRAYGWTANNYSYYQIESMSDYDFASFCRNTLFGTDFPE